jgi:hypothetical protein
MNQNQMAAPLGMMGGFGGQICGNYQNMAGHGMPNQIYMGNQG